MGVIDVSDNGGVCLQLEMERALLEGEHQTELEQLLEEQQSISALKRRQLVLIERAAGDMEKVSNDGS